METAAPSSAWGSCRYCGTAVAPGATACGLCGADRPIAAGALGSAPVAVRRRIRITNGLRAMIVLVVVAGLAYAIGGAVLAGPPNVTDPLTTTGTYTVAPGSVPFLTGDVTGGDYVIGNFTSVTPYEATVSITAYNSTQWNDLVHNGTGTPSWSTPSEGSGRIVFSAEYTDNYTFVLTNPYPAASHITITVYVATQYESNVGDDGFG